MMIITSMYRCVSSLTVKIFRGYKVTFERVIEEIRHQSTSEADKGQRFEKLIKNYLLTDKGYANLFEKVWLWEDFPYAGSFGGQDIGIDLVAKVASQQNEAEQYWAIQCKCFADEHSVTWTDISTFIALSSKSFTTDKRKNVKFARSLLVTSNSNLSTHARNALQDQTPDVTWINSNSLTDSAVDWSKLKQGISGHEAHQPIFKPYPHQKVAIEAARDYFVTNDQERGKLIMACGTGKTFTSLRIAEDMTKSSGWVLFLVPSIALLSQTLGEWRNQVKDDFYPICICSDTKIVGRQRSSSDHLQDTTLDLSMPATTDIAGLKAQIEAYSKLNSGLKVVFSTYQSIDVVIKAQQATGVDFDLVICDEAHRTTGYTYEGEDDSHFTKVHSKVVAKKFMYMTATPRLYAEKSKRKASANNTEVYSMDDEETYGLEFHRLGFRKAVNHDLLSDYKVVILTLDDKEVPKAIQKILADENASLNTDDLHKLSGCINALSKHIIGDGGSLDGGKLSDIMKRSVAFCSRIKSSNAVSGSEDISQAFNELGPEYKRLVPKDKQKSLAMPNAKHIDGSMNASKRKKLMAWLKEEDTPASESRILTNVRCLSEGVDVPSLDAVMFLSPKNSQIDVVQSVGRVMRKSSGKKYGYIIIPIVVRSDVKPEDALDRSENYRVVWQVLNALRSHDEGFKDVVNKIALNKLKPNQIIVGKSDEKGTGNEADDAATMGTDSLQQQELDLSGLQNVIYAKIVDKVGEQGYFEDWAKSVAELAERHIERIGKLVDQDGSHRQAFDEFLASLQRNINPAVTQQQAVEMLSQHIISKPVFEALFEESSFAKDNVVSQAMDKILKVIEAQSLEEEDKQELADFYDYVKNKASGIDNAEGKQKVIVELYDKFFKAGFPKLVEQLGIVYTPIEVVDFIIHSVDDLLKKEFNTCLSGKNVNILDPFTGTGTFITRLLQSGLIKHKDLKRKYSQEIFANEIILLAYYIAAVNIENSYLDVMRDKTYQAFPGIVLADTFQMSEDDQSTAPSLQENSNRIKRQKQAPLMVIFSNPPYSIGQRSANDAAGNQDYPKLHRRIDETYTNSSAKLLRSLYDSYVKAFRWATDRLDPERGGIIAFVSNGSWLEDASKDGFRASLEREFSSIYVFNLRGNQRTSGELSKKEGGKIFGSGSRTPVSITFLVKQPSSQGQKTNIYYHDIGDYLDRKMKLKLVAKRRSVLDQKMEKKWSTIQPNAHNDWINQRYNFPDDFIPLTRSSYSILPTSVPGIVSNRDAWVYNFSEKRLKKNIEAFLEFYNEEVTRYSRHSAKLTGATLANFTNNNALKIKWTHKLRSSLNSNQLCAYGSMSTVVSLYRPFQKQNLYYDQLLIERPGKFPSLKSSRRTNVFILLPGTSAKTDFCALSTDGHVDLNILDAGATCIPLYTYHEVESGGLLDDSGSKFTRRVNICNNVWQQAQTKYDTNLSKEDLFYYAYGFLHSKDYQESFKNNLTKEIPKIPLTDSREDFTEFIKAGRQLADLHINYEQAPFYPNCELRGLESKNFKVIKMRFRDKADKSTLIFNDSITISKIPPKTYDYVLNGKSALDWVIDRYQTKKDKASQITNDPNDWAKEIGNPRYILDLVLKVVYVSCKTVDIVSALPRLRF